MILPIVSLALCSVYYAMDLARAGLPMSVVEWHELTKNDAGLAKIDKIEQRWSTYDCFGRRYILYLKMKGGATPRFVIFPNEIFSKEWSDIHLKRPKFDIVCIDFDVYPPIVAQVFQCSVATLVLGMVLLRIIR